MAVYKRSYKSYAGALTPVGSRFLVLSKYALADVFAARSVAISFVVCFFPIVIWIALIYITNSETAQALLQVSTNNLLSVNAQFFARILKFQGWLALFFTAWVGPGLVSIDLSNNALPLFLSRPFSRAEYVLGKMTALLLLLSAITWVPILMLFGLQSQMAKGWFFPNLWIAGSIFAGSWIWIIFLSLFALAMSALVKWRIVATGLSLAAFFVPAGFGEAVNATLRTHWGRLLNLPYLMDVIWSGLFGVRLDFYTPFGYRQIPQVAAWSMLLMVTVFCLLVLERRLRAREVVRG